MNKLRLAILILILSQNLLACSQLSYGIKNAYAYKAVRVPGIIARDESGRPMKPSADTVHFIYVETSGTEISWLEAWRNNRKYKLSVYPVSQLPLEVGKDKITGERIFLSPSKGNHLWQLGLSPEPESKPAPVRSKNGEILLQGRFRKKTFTIRINKEVELLQPDAV